MTVTEHGHCRESLSDCRDYCRTTVGLSGSVGLLSEVTVGLSDRGSASDDVKARSNWLIGKKNDKPALRLSQVLWCCETYGTLATRGQSAR